MDLVILDATLCSSASLNVLEVLHPPELPPSPLSLYLHAVILRNSDQSYHLGLVWPSVWAAAINGLLLEYVRAHSFSRFNIPGCRRSALPRDLGYEALTDVLYKYKLFCHLGT